MKLMLVMIFCTAIYQQCQEPHVMPGSYNNWYNCMLAGYKEASRKMKEIGKSYTITPKLTIVMLKQENSVIQTQEQLLLFVVNSEDNLNFKS